MQTKLKQRVDYFVRFGSLLEALSNEGEPSIDWLSEEEMNELRTAVQQAYQQNKWFTSENMNKMFRGLATQLKEDNILDFLGRYGARLENKHEPKNVALILAGNIPMVGFHDVFCVIMSGNKAIVKPSSSDAVLLPSLWAAMKKVDQEINAMLKWQPMKLNGFDAAIATGSNNSSRYFDHYFSKYPHIIRKNRNSVAVIEGDETEEELKKLGEDVFSYFGLGCRNITKLMIPESYDINTFIGAIYDFNSVVEHNKYANNYDYHKALWLLNKEELLDNGFLLLKESDQIASPVGSLFYERYSSKEVVENYLKEHKEEIQCVVGRNFLPFGKAQEPELTDFADDVDTMEFLLDLNEQQN